MIHRFSATAAVLLLLASTLTEVWSIPGSGTVVAQTANYPVLNLGDTWRFHYASGETSVETIEPVELCGSSQCLVDAEISSQWSDIVWRLDDWTIVKENYTDATGSYFDTYSPPVRPYDWPLILGKQWTINSIVTEELKNTTGLHYSTFTILRTRKVVSESTVNVPAGSFTAFLVEQYKDGTLTQRRWLSLEVKDLIRWEQYDSSGQTIDSSVLLSYTLANGTSSPGHARIPFAIPSLAPTLLLRAFGGFLVFGATITVLAVLLERRRLKQRKNGETRNPFLVPT